jgi:hypothetical protein
MQWLLQWLLQGSAMAVARRCKPFARIPLSSNTEMFVVIYLLCE